MRAVDAVVLGVEKKTVAKLQEPRTVKKIVMLDKHVAMTFAGKLEVLTSLPYSHKLFKRLARRRSSTCKQGEN